MFNLGMSEAGSAILPARSMISGRCHQLRWHLQQGKVGVIARDCGVRRTEGSLRIVDQPRVKVIMMEALGNERLVPLHWPLEWLSEETGSLLGRRQWNQPFRSD